MRTRFAAALVACGVLAFASAVAAPVDPASIDGASWIEVRTPHFRILADADPGAVQGIGQRLEQFCAMLQVLHPDLRAYPALPVDVYVFRDAARTLQFSPPAPGDAAAFAMAGPGRIAFVVNAQAEGTPRAAVVCNEYTHLFLRANLPSVPAWLDEGLAGCYGTLKPRGRRMEFGHAQPEWARWLDSHAYSTLDQLFAVDAGSSAYRTGEALRTATSAEGWAITHYLLAEPERAARLDSVLVAMRNGARPADAFQQEFPSEQWPRLVDAVKRYARTGAFETRSVRLAAQLKSFPVTSRAVSSAETFTRLADLLLCAGTDRLADAGALYRVALARDSAYAPARAGAGYVADLRGDRALAERCYARAESGAPSEPRVALLAGLGTMQRYGRSQDKSAAGRRAAAALLVSARRRFQRCLQFDAGNPEALGNLGRLDVLERRVSEATCDSLEAVVDALPGRADFAEALRSARAVVERSPQGVAAARARAARAATAKPAGSSPGIAWPAGETEMKQAAAAFNAGRYEEATQLLRGARTMFDPTDVPEELDQQIARCRVAIGLKHARAATAAGSPAAALDTLAALQPVAPDEECRTLLQQARVDTRARQHLARASQFTRAGNLAAARAEYTAALTLPLTRQMRTFVEGLLAQFDRAGQGR